jgi:hypothetical protein
LTGLRTLAIVVVVRRHVMAKRNGSWRKEAAVRAENERLKRELRALGAMAIESAEGMPPEWENQFLRRVLAFEQGGTTTLLAELHRIGIEPPPPDALSDDALTSKLWEIINGLATLGVFLERTDHLSDRALYEHLHGQVLPDEMDELRTGDGAVWHVDILGGCSLEDLRLHLKYYADEEQRREWAREWPEDDMPPHEDPPYDRDRLLPAPRW